MIKKISEKSDAETVWVLRFQVWLPRILFTQGLARRLAEALWQASMTALEPFLAR